MNECMNVGVNECQRRKKVFSEWMVKTIEKSYLCLLDSRQLTLTIMEVYNTRKNHWSMFGQAVENQHYSLFYFFNGLN